MKLRLRLCTVLFIIMLTFTLSAHSHNCLDLHDLNYNESQYLNYKFTEKDIAFINESVTLCNKEYLLKNELIYINSSNIIFDCNGATISKAEADWPYRSNFIKIYAYYGTFDNHIVRNVTIKNCIFKNTDISAIAPVHHITFAHVKQFAYDGINFINNTFYYEGEEGISSSIQTVIRFNHIENSLLENNTFINTDVRFEIAKNLTMRRNKFTFTTHNTFCYLDNVYLSNIENNVFLTSLTYNGVDSNITNNYFYSSVSLTPSCAPPKSIISFERNVVYRGFSILPFFKTDLETNVFLNGYKLFTPNIILNFDECYR